MFHFPCLLWFNIHMYITYIYDTTKQRIRTDIYLRTTYNVYV